VAKGSDGILSGLITFCHEKLGLSPNNISVIGFAVGIIAATVVALGYLVAGLILLAVSQVIDGVDGGVARQYALISERGKTLEIVFDRLSELAIFLALVSVGLVSFRMAILAFVAILLVTIVEPMSGFDPGFKRFMMYFGYLGTVLFGVQGFEIAMRVVFWANLSAFVVGTIMVDYRLQREVDTQAILRRESERVIGVQPFPDDPPSLLSRLFA